MPVSSCRLWTLESLPLRKKHKTKKTLLFTVAKKPKRQRALMYGLQPAQTTVQQPVGLMALPFNVCGLGRLVDWWPRGLEMGAWIEVSKEVKNIRLCSCIMNVHQARSPRETKNLITWAPDALIWCYQQAPCSATSGSVPMG